MSETLAVAPSPEEYQSLKNRLATLEREIGLLRSYRSSNLGGIKIFALDASHSFGEDVVRHLNMELSPHKEAYHPDRETYVRSLVNVRRAATFVISSLYTDEQESVNEKVAKLLYMVGALRDASAAEITVIVPALAYGRSDRKVKSREAVITKYLAIQMEALGVDRIITMDVHSLQAYQNAFRECKPDHLTCRIHFAEYFAHQLAKVDPRDISILSPDAGSFARCDAFRQSLMLRLGSGIGMAWLDKRHTDDDVAKQADNIIGDVRPIMIAFDDMIATGTTIVIAARLAMEKGAKQVWCAATHGLFVGQANELLADKAVHRIVVSDTIAPFRLNTQVLSKTEVVPTTELWAEAIRRTFTGESLSSMFSI